MHFILATSACGICLRVDEIIHLFSGPAGVALPVVLFALGGLVGWTQRSRDARALARNRVLSLALLASPTLLILAVYAYVSEYDIEMWLAGWMMGALLALPLAAGALAEAGVRALRASGPKDAWGGADLRTRLVALLVSGLFVVAFPLAIFMMVVSGL